MSRPNVVVLILDSLRADALSCYSGGDLTPNIDAIAADGLRFENAFAPASWTVPSHASMFTGAYPSEHGTDNDNRYLNPHYRTLAEELRDAGYTTALYSNNVHLTDEFGFTRGFDVAESSHAVSDDADAIDWNEFLKHRDHEAGPRKYLEILGHLLENRDKDLVASVRNAARLKYNYHFGDNGARATNEYLRDHSFEAPYFLFVNYMEPHNPFRPPADYRDAEPPDVEGWRYDHGLDTLTEAELDTLRDLYRGEVAYLDERIGELYDALNDENTVFVVTADHGVSIGEHGHLYHGASLYNTVTRVPLLVSGVDRTGTVPHSVGLVGLYRTVCELAGVDPETDRDAPLRGHDLLAVEDDRDVLLERQGEATDIVETIREERGDNGPVEANRYLRALVRGRHKLIREYDPDTGAWVDDPETAELYDYWDDPDETTQVTDATVRAEMRAALDDVVDSLDPRENTGGVADLDADVTDRLQELGYIT